MTILLIVVHVLAAVAVIALVLVQHGKGADMGAAFGSGASQTLFGARGSANFLTRLTGGLATVFFLTSLTLAYLSGDRAPESAIERSVISAPEKGAPAPAAPAPSAPPVPEVPK